MSPPNEKFLAEEKIDTSAYLISSPVDRRRNKLDAHVYETAGFAEELIQHELKEGLRVQGQLLLA